MTNLRSIFPLSLVCPCSLNFLVSFSNGPSIGVGVVIAVCKCGVCMEYWRMRLYLSAGKWFARWSLWGLSISVSSELRQYRWGYVLSFLIAFSYLVQDIWCDPIHWFPLLSGLMPCRGLAIFCRARPVRQIHWVWVEHFSLYQLSRLILLTGWPLFYPSTCNGVGSL